MSQPPPPYQGPPGGPPYPPWGDRPMPPYQGPPPPPRRPRPSGWWFAVGGALVVAAVAIFVGLVAWLVVGIASTDVRLPADGQPHEVTVGTDGDRMIWRDGGFFDVLTCAVVDVETGEDIPLDSTTGEFTRSFGSTEWKAAFRFEPGSGHLLVRCETPGGQQEVEIGPAPSVAGFVGGVILAIAIPGVLGLAGLAVLVVTGVLWTTRPPRPRA